MNLLRVLTFDVHVHVQGIIFQGSLLCTSILSEVNQDKTLVTYAGVGVTS